MYGTMTIGLILAGRLKELKVVYILTGNIDLQLKYLYYDIVLFTVSETSILILTSQFIME